MRKGDFILFWALKPKIGKKGFLLPLCSKVTWVYICGGHPIVIKEKSALHEKRSIK